MRLKRVILEIIIPNPDFKVENALNYTWREIS
jgi:hypothetical protein